MSGFGWGASGPPVEALKATQATCPTPGIAHRSPHISAARGAESDTLRIPAKMKSSVPTATENVVRSRSWLSCFIVQFKTDLLDVGKFFRRFLPSRAEWLKRGGLRSVPFWMTCPENRTLQEQGQRAAKRPILAFRIDHFCARKRPLVRLERLGGWLLKHGRAYVAVLKPHCACSIAISLVMRLAFCA